MFSFACLLWPVILSICCHLQHILCFVPHCVLLMLMKKIMHITMFDFSSLITFCFFLVLFLFAQNKICIQLTQGVLPESCHDFLPKPSKDKQYYFAFLKIVPLPIPVWQVGELQTTADLNTNKQWMVHLFFSLANNWCNTPIWIVDFGNHKHTDIKGVFQTFSDMHYSTWSLLYCCMWHWLEMSACVGGEGWTCHAVQHCGPIDGFLMVYRQRWSLYGTED